MLTWAVLLSVILNITLAGEENPRGAPRSITDIGEEVQIENLGMIRAERAIQDAKRDLKGEKSLENSVVSAGAGYSYSSQGTSGFSGETGLTLPIFPQTTLGGTVEINPDGTFEESISLSIKPFVKKDPTYMAEKNYGTALVRKRYLQNRLYADAEKAVLDLLLRDMERTLSNDTLALEEQKYELVQRQQETGTASFQDVQTQLVFLTEARQNLFNTELRFLSDRKTLMLLFAPKEEEIYIVPVSPDQLITLAEDRSSLVEQVQGKVPASEQLAVLTLQLEALEAELRATPVWTPDLGIYARVDLPETTLTMGLNFSFSPKQIRNDDRETLMADIEEIQLDIQVEIFSIGLQKDLLKQSIVISEQALEASLLQKEKDTVALQEVELLFQQGRRTSLELDQMRLNLRRDVIQSFRAAAELYAAQAKFLLLFGNHP